MSKADAPIPGKYATIAAAAAIAAGVTGVASAQSSLFPLSPPAPSTELVSARLISEHDALAPGREHRLAVTMTIAPQWHIYWANPGDTGTPPMIRFSAPEGVEIGPIVWPAPMRYIHAGGILVDYTYENEATLVVPVRVTHEYSGDAPITIEADAEWLVCKEACIPGDARLSITLPLASKDEPARNEAHAPRFAAADARIPRPLPDGSPITAQWRDNTLRIHAPGAQRMVFYPLTPALPIPVSAVRDGKATGDTLTIAYPAAIHEVGGVEAVVEVVGGDAPGMYQITVPSPEGE